MSMTTVVVEYLNERAATAEKLAIEAYEIIDSLIDVHDECKLVQGSDAAGMYCTYHQYFQNDMPDNKCPQRRAIEWLERNEGLYWSMPWWQIIMIIFAFTGSVFMGFLTATIVVSFLGSLHWAWWVWLIVTQKVIVFAQIVPLARFARDHYPNTSNWVRTLAVWGVANSWPVTLFYVIRAMMRSAPENPVEGRTSVPLSDHS